MNASWTWSRQHKATGSAPRERSGCLSSTDTRQRGVTQWGCECNGQMGSYNTQGRRWSRTSCSFVGTLCGFHHTAHQQYTARTQLVSTRSRPLLPQRPLGSVKFLNAQGGSIIAFPIHFLLRLLEMLSVQKILGPVPQLPLLTGPVISGTM